MYTKSSGEFYEGFFGLKDSRHFVAGLYNHATEEIQTLADFHLALNESKKLFVKSTWDSDVIHKTWVS